MSELGTHPIVSIPAGHEPCGNCGTVLPELVPCPCGISNCPTGGSVCGPCARSIRRRVEGR